MKVQELTALVQDKLSERFGEALLATEMHYDFPVFYIQREQVFAILQYLKENSELNFHFLTTLCGMHFPEKHGQELGVMYQLHNMPENRRIRVKAFMPIDEPVIDSVTSLWNTANWMERETYDFFGIQFKGHPDLRRILNMDEMNYFPLRKEYPLEDASRDDKDDKMFGR
ncbi:MAG: NADH-quinone oxidoreductase subunit C [Saprospiraceae bacterium]